MCLCISDSSTSLKRKVRRKGDKIIAYKILKFKGNKLYAPYMDHEWFRHKTMISDREGKDPTKMTKEESSCSIIYKGLHLYSGLNKARYELRYFGTSVRIYKVEVDPKDIIAFGFDEIAVHKAKIIGPIRKRK